MYSFCWLKNICCKTAFHVTLAAASSILFTMSFDGIILSGNNRLSRRYVVGSTIQLCVSLMFAGWSHLMMYLSEGIPSIKHNMTIYRYSSTYDGVISDQLKLENILSQKCFDMPNYWLSQVRDSLYSHLSLFCELLEGMNYILFTLS